MPITQSCHKESIEQWLKKNLALSLGADSHSTSYSTPLRAPVTVYKTKAPKQPNCPIHPSLKSHFTVAPPQFTILSNVVWSCSPGILELLPLKVRSPDRILLWPQGTGLGLGPGLSNSQWDWILPLQDSPILSWDSATSPSHTAQLWLQYQIRMTVLMFPHLSQIIKIPHIWFQKRTELPLTSTLSPQMWIHLRGAEILPPACLSR